MDMQWNQLVFDDDTEQRRFQLSFDVTYQMDRTKTGALRNSLSPTSDDNDDDHDDSNLQSSVRMPRFVSHMLSDSLEVSA